MTVRVHVASNGLLGKSGITPKEARRGHRLDGGLSGVGGPSRRSSWPFIPATEDAALRGSSGLYFGPRPAVPCSCLLPLKPHWRRGAAVPTRKAQRLRCSISRCCVGTLRSKSGAVRARASRSIWGRCFRESVRQRHRARAGFDGVHSQGHVGVTRTTRR